MKPFRQYHLPIIEISIALMIILLPLSNNPDLMNGIQTAKSFNFFYSIWVLVGMGSVALLFRKNKLQFNITIIDVLLLAYVSWVTINKFLIHDVYCFSLKYYELLGLSVFYVILRLINQKYYLLFLVSICISGTIQAIYGCLQLWGYYPSNHGLFKMTGSFFNPGPYAGFLAGILPIAVGLYLSYREYEFKKEVFEALRLKSLKLTAFVFERFDVTRLKSLIPMSIGMPFEKFKHEASNNQTIFEENHQTQSIERETSNTSTPLEQLLFLTIKYIALTTIISILLVLPAARSRAAWLGAIIGVAYLASHKYNLRNWINSFINGRIKSPFEAKRSPEHRGGDLGVKTKKVLLIFFTTLILAGSAFTLYHYKKDSADGRMLIWTVTSNIIKDYPMFGVGQDMFKAHYMNYQADYFRNHQNSKYEMVADDNQYAFNEALNIWTENGIIGITLMLGVLVLVFFSKTIDPVIARRNDEAIFYIKNSYGLTSDLKTETILKASILSLFVFGLFAYPNEILPTKITAIVCVALLAGLKMPSLKRKESSFVSFVTKPLRPLWLNPLLKLSFLTITIGALFYTIPQVNNCRLAYNKWKDAFDLYQYGMYEECLDDYEEVNKYLNTNGEFLINYGKALSIAEKHAEAVKMLEQAKSYQSNSILYTALGDSQKTLKEYNNGEQNYWQASNMAPGKFYPQYLLAKLYYESSQQQKAIEIATLLLKKEIKIESTAIKEIHNEMEKIIERNAEGDSLLIENTTNGQKGRNNHISPQKTAMVTLPTALSIINGIGKTERRCGDKDK